MKKNTTNQGIAFTMLAFAIIMASVVVGAITMWLVISGPNLNLAISIVTAPIIFLLTALTRKFLITPWITLVKLAENFLIHRQLPYPAKNLPCEPQQTLQTYLYAIAEKIAYREASPVSSQQAELKEREKAIITELQNQNAVIVSLVQKQMEALQRLPEPITISDDTPSLDSTVDTLLVDGTFWEELTSLQATDHHQVAMSNISNDILKPIIEFTTPLFGHSVRLIQHQDTTAPAVMCQPAPLRRILLQLIIMNANNNTAFGTVTLKTYQCQSFVCIALSDNQEKSALHQDLITSLFHTPITNMGGKITVNQQHGYGMTTLIKFPFSEGEES